MTKLLNKNIQALITNKNITLAEKLKAFLKNNISRFVKEGFNIYDCLNKSFIYTSEEEFEYFLNTIEEKTFKYPFVCIYGVGNALMLKSLAKTHKCLFVFEKELELLALALSSVDLSDELKNKKLFFIDISDLKMQLYLAMLFNQNNIYEYLGLYEMFIQSNFYKNFYFEEMQKLDELCLKTIHSTLTSRGAYTPTLPLLVYEQFLQNIKDIIYNIPLKKLIYERKNKFNNAAVISAGPSLNEQIELLKHYQDKVVIFCTDGAFCTLKKHDILPDYVLNTDVDDLALNFFKDIKEKMPETIFVCGYPTHKSIIEFLQSQNQNLIISLGSNDPACKMDILDDFGYLELGSNISHMCYALAVLLGFKNIFMLGQDFALSKEGNSHTNAYALGEQRESKLECAYFEVEAYGGGIKF